MNNGSSYGGQTKCWVGGRDCGLQAYEHDDGCYDFDGECSLLFVYNFGFRHTQNEIYRLCILRPKTNIERAAEAACAVDTFAGCLLAF